MVTGLACDCANAAAGDTLRPYVDISYAHEDNLLRLSPSQLIDGNGADSYRRLDTGLTLDRTIGRQHVSGDLKLSRTMFEKFVALNNDSKDAHATWNWQLGNKVDGNFGAQYTQALAPFTEFRSSQRNVKTVKNTFGEAKWRIHPSWSLHIGATHQTLAYDLSSQQIGNRNEDTQELGLDFLPATGSSVGVVLRRTHDSYPVQQLLGALIVGNSYRQHDYKLKADWILSSKTRLQFLGGLVQRDYETFQSRNKTTPSIRTTGIWQASVKTNVTVVAYHDISPSDDLSVNYSVNNGVSLASSWEVSNKVHLDAFFRRENRDFNAASAFSSVLPVNRQEKSRFGSIQLSYVPRKDVQLTTSVFRDDLDATFAQRSYRAEGVVLGLRSTY